MKTESASYSDVFRQWVEISERLNARLDELRPITMQISEGNRDVAILSENSRLEGEIGRLNERFDELSAELIRLTSS